MRAIANMLKFIAIALAMTAPAHGQMLFGVNTNTFVYGGGLSYNAFAGAPGDYATDIYIELRASSGNPLPGYGDYVQWAVNDAYTVAIEGVGYGNGLNWPFIVLKGYDSYGNWSYIIIELGEWWPNDNQAHTMKLQLLQAGYEGNFRKDLNVTMDGRLLPARITSDIGSILNIALYNGGNFALGYGSYVGVSRFVATAGVYPSPYAAPIFVEGGDLTQNYGWGYNLNYFPDVTYEIYFDDSCPGC